MPLLLERVNFTGSKRRRGTKVSAGDRAVDSGKGETYGSIGLP